MKITNGKWLLLAVVISVPLGFRHMFRVHTTADSAPVSGVPFVVEHDLLRVPEDSPLRARLAVQEVKVAKTPHQVVVPGQVDANPSCIVNILPPLTGRIESLKVELGDTVTKGQLLARIASGDMAQAYSDYDKARDALDLAKKTRDRTRGVQKTGASAVKDIEAAESGVVQAEAEYLRAKTRLEALGGKPGAAANDQFLDIVSPVDGVVTSLNVGRGGMVDDPTAAMMTVTDISSVWVTANVPENLLSTLHSGDSATIRLSAYPDEVLRGDVSSVSSVVAPDTRRLPIHISFANARGRLLPNMFADVAIETPQQDQVLVPQSALLMNNDSTTVLVEVSPWAFERRKVEIGYDEGAMARVTSGLKPGERVVVKGGVLMND